MESKNNYRNNNRGGNRGSRGFRANRGNRGNRGSRGFHRQGNYYNDNDYFDRALNNNIQKNENKEHKRKNYYNKNKYKDNINDIDDYYNAMNNKNEINENEEKEEDEYNYNIFRKSQKNRKYNNIKDNELNDSSKQAKEDKRRTFISYNQLKEILTKEDNEIIQFFTKYKDLSEVIENTKFSPDMINLMIKLLSKISQINSGPASVILNQIFTNTNFLEKIREKIKEENFYDSKYLDVFYDISIMSNKLIDKFSDDTKRIKYSELILYADFIQDLINKGKIEKNLEIALKIIDVLNDLREKEKNKKLFKLEEKQKKIEKENLEKSQKNINNIINNINLIPIDYRTRNIELTEEDFNNRQIIEIAANIIKGSYISYERYINTMFYLEYEDCYKSLRKTINDFQSIHRSVNTMDKKELQQLSKNSSDIYIYLKGEIRSFDIKRDGVILEL